MHSQSCTQQSATGLFNANHQPHSLHHGHITLIAEAFVAARSALQSEYEFVDDRVSAALDAGLETGDFWTNLKVVNLNLDINIPRLQTSIERIDHVHDVLHIAREVVQKMETR